MARSTTFAFETADHEAEGLAEFIARRIEDRWVEAGDCLVLCNSRLHARRIRKALDDRGVRAETFFREQALDSEPAREAMTLLTLRLEPADRVAERAWLGIDQPEAREATYRRLWSAADEAGLSIGEAIRRIKAGELVVQWSATAVARWDELTERLAALEPLGEDLGALIDALMPDGDEDLEALRASALLALQSREGAGSVSAFPTAVRYAVGMPEVPFDATFVRIMSLHRSKGLTAKLVAIAGLVDGLVPREPDADATMAERAAHQEEQRRLLYVGITRSSETLVLSSFARLPFSEAMRFGARYGHVRRPAGGGEPFVGTFASPLLADLGSSLPDALPGPDWIALNAAARS